jgi:hypothetical protein
MRVYPANKMHGTAFHVFTDEQVAQREASQAAHAERLKLAAQIRAAEAVGMRMVYGAVRAELPLVKIGTSRNLSGRDGRLRRMPGCRLVALQAGGFDVEREVHARLKPHRVWANLRGFGFGEHFTICDDVVEWVNETRHALGLGSIDIAELMSQYV